MNDLVGVVVVVVVVSMNDLVGYSCYSCIRTTLVLIVRLAYRLAYSQSSLSSAPKKFPAATGAAVGSGEGEGLADMGGGLTLSIKTSKLGMRGSASTPHLDSMGSSFGEKGRSFFPDQSSENPQASGFGLGTFAEEEEEDHYDDFDAAEEGGLVW